jgi:hypothetical protein
MRPLRSVCLVAMLLGNAPLTAQVGGIGGRVRNQSSASSIAFATIELVGMRRTDIADSLGVFQFGNVPPGRYLLRSRRLGFEPATDTIVVVADTITDIVVEMTPIPQRLAEVTVNGRVVDVPFRFEEVYRRGTKGFGYFIPREEIELRQPYATRDLLAMIPGVRVEANEVLFCRCGGCAGIEGLMPQKSVDVFIDGVRVTATDADPDKGRVVERALAMVMPTGIQAIEVYSGLAQIPADFHVSACAVVAIWTKRY